ncbi:MAG TPA: rod shape-determining protein MreC [Burkholderiales bacterium]|nr:rod shape-determining protein MreC [Burkholderiales bacterium]
MEYSPPPFFKRGPSLITRFAFFSVLSIVLLVADARFGYLRAVRALFSVVVVPLQQVSALPAAGLARVGEFFVTQAQLRRENDQLRRQALADAPALQTRESLAAENDNLRQLVGLRERLGRKTFAAEILYAPRDPFTRRVVVDRGGQDGLVPGLAVLDRTGVVGQVTRVFPWASEVTLVTDKEHAVPIQVQRSGLRGVTFGVGYDGTLELRFMPVNADIQNGDLLVTSGIDGTYPPGLPVAVVSNIERNAAYAFARITCTPAAGVSSYRQVLIVDKGEPQPENPLASEAAAMPTKARKGGN